MPDFRFHIIFGMVFMTILFVLDKVWLNFFFVGVDPMLLVFYAPLLLFSFVACDCDHPDSIPRFTILALLGAMIIYGFMYNIAQHTLIGLCIFFGLVLFLQYIPGFAHRQCCHSIIFIGIMTLLVVLGIGWKIAFLFGMGAFSHLLSDNELKWWS